MVFFYRIRGGPCKGELSHVTLRPEDVICYVGRDKHENEDLIAHGWPGDIWFHVDGVSSAHVYFRLNYDQAAAYHGNENIPLTGAIPMDCLPEDSVQDMMQIVKHNSIEGSKMASAKIVWTPHANLKKNFDMEAGQVTYHDTKQCRYGRCHKDRARVKALEKTKSIDRTDIDLYAEKKKNERALIERRKQHKKIMARGPADTSGDQLFDPIASDQKRVLQMQTRQGDEQSGIDQGLAALEGLALGDPSFISIASIDDKDTPRRGDTASVNDATDDAPIWKQERTKDEADYSDNELALFLLERGYPRSAVNDFMRQSPNSCTHVEALRELWTNLRVGEQDSSSSPSSVESNNIDRDELLETRQEEREVLDAIFGEDIEWITSNHAPVDTATVTLDASVPITTYEPPDRYFLGSNPPPELRLEMYVSPTNYPFAGEAPILALVGGGIPREYLHRMTLQLFKEATTQAVEESPGNPYLFTLITHVGEIWEAIIEEEGAAFVKATEEARKARSQQLREIEKEKQAALGLSSQDTDTPVDNVISAQSTNFATEQERRAYAANVVARYNAGRPIANQGKEETKTVSSKGRKHYNTGVRDVDLINDLFS